uniref:Transmembrane protein n=1 Tax=Toxoplasma gondii (strain ATCC 50861 / VEG) TaxID=432359 RepID=A0A0F7VB86_TOXGV|nr:TPA: hypothetical protein BN1205_094125 [Toxoplasma gondii VEG]
MPISRYSVCCVLMTLFHCLYMSVAEYATQLNPSISSKPTIPVNSHETGDPIFKDVQQHQIPLENAGPPRCAFRVSNSPARHQLVSVHTLSARTCAAGDQKVNFRQKRKNVNLRRHAFTTSSANDIQSKQRDSDRADSVAAARRGPKTGREVEGLLRWGRPSHIRLVGHETNRDTSFYSRHLDLPQVDNPSSLFERAAMTKSYTGRTGHAGRVTNTEYHHLPGSFGHIKKRVPRTQPGQSLASSFFNVSAGFNFTVLLGMVCTFSLLLAIIWVFYQVRVVVRELSKLADFLVSTNELPFVVV